MNDRELGASWRAHLTKAAIAKGVSTLAALTWQHFVLRGGLRGYEIASDLPYGHEPEQRLDVWRSRAPTQGLRPVVLFLHGGGFQHLDRRSHWAFAERFAEAGAVVFNVDYRLAPQHRYPAAADDATRALRYAREHALAFGGDPQQIVVSGCSAGANLALGLALTEPEHVRACVLFSGLLQVSDMPRLYRARRMSSFLQARCASIGCDYPADSAGNAPWQLPLVPDPRFDPLLYLERMERLPPTFAPTFIATGTADQVLEDSLRLRACLAEHGVACQLDVEPHGGHGMQGMLTPSVRAMWERCMAFLRAQGIQLSSARSSGAASWLSQPSAPRAATNDSAMGAPSSSRAGTTI